MQDKLNDRENGLMGIIAKLMNDIGKLRAALALAGGESE